MLWLSIAMCLYPRDRACPNHRKVPVSRALPNMHHLVCLASIYPFMKNDILDSLDSMFVRDEAHQW